VCTVPQAEAELSGGALPRGRRPPSCAYTRSHQKRDGRKLALGAVLRGAAPFLWREAFGHPFRAPSIGPGRSGPQPRATVTRAPDAKRRLCGGEGATHSPPLRTREPGTGRIYPFPRLASAALCGHPGAPAALRSSGMNRKLCNGSWRKREREWNAAERSSNVRAEAGRSELVSTL
jgi:hypothetical protein